MKVIPFPLLKRAPASQTMSPYEWLNELVDRIVDAADSTQSEFLQLKEKLNELHVDQKALFKRWQEGATESQLSPGGEAQLEADLRSLMKRVGDLLHPWLRAQRKLHQLNIKTGSIMTEASGFSRLED